MLCRPAFFQKLTFCLYPIVHFVFVHLPASQYRSLALWAISSWSGSKKVLEEGLRCRRQRSLAHGHLTQYPWALLFGSPHSRIHGRPSRLRALPLRGRSQEPPGCLSSGPEGTFPLRRSHESRPPMSLQFQVPCPYRALDPAPPTSRGSTFTLD
jgi:hypothetical protein